MEYRPRPACQARACSRAPRRSRPAPRHSPTGLAAAGIAAGSSRRRPGPGLCGPRAAPLRPRELAWSREVARTRPVSTAAFGPPRRGRAWASRRPPSRGADACCQHNTCYPAAQRKRAAAHRARGDRLDDRAVARRGVTGGQAAVQGGGAGRVSPTTRPPGGDVCACWMVCRMWLAAAAARARLRQIVRSRAMIDNNIMRDDDIYSGPI